MSSVWFSRQNLGIFQSDLPKITGALGRSMQSRTHIDKYTVLDLKDDPKFPFDGASKTIYYSVSIGLAAGEFTVYIASRSVRNCPTFQREKRTFEVLQGAKGVLQPLLIQEVGNFEYMISDLFNRGDLHSYIIDPSRVLKSYDTHWISYSVVSALLECHAKGVVHRDLKPENVLVRQLDDGTLEIKLMDFGLAFIMNEDDEVEATRNCCSPAYLSPDTWTVFQQTGKFLPANYSRDAWPMGLILYSLAIRKRVMQKVVSGIMVVQENRNPLGLFDSEIRALLYGDQKNLPSLLSIQERMRAILIRTYPMCQVFKDVESEPSPKQESVPAAPSLFSRIFCFQRSKKE